MWQKVLFHHDFSDEAAARLAWAKKALVAEGGSILLAHVVNPVIGGSTPEKVALAQEELDCLAATAAPLTVETAVATGDPLEELARIAREGQCTSALVLVDDSDEASLIAPVLALPQLIFLKGTPNREEGLFDHVSVALDLAPERTDSLLAELKKYLSGRARTLELIHSVPLENPESASELMLAADQALTELREEMAKTFPFVRSTLLTGNPEETLPAHLSRSEASLLVLGLSRHGELWELFLGGTAQRLLGELENRPLLLLPL
jgi:nucleotide-binding universal stress UspA family protein